uniref:EB domain-containing protein n=1 Tax=Trichuris muris TaxID=70415 RepID=A0A5S6QBP4_TRIMR
MLQLAPCYVSRIFFLITFIHGLRATTEHCDGHKDCKGRKVCVDRACVLARPTGMRCLSKAQCDSPMEECKYNHCWRPEEARSSCTADKDCPASMICLRGKCVSTALQEEQEEKTKSGKVGQRCADDHNCRIANSYCILGYCQCKMNSVYDGVKCVQLAEIGESCGEENLPCRSENSECYMGICVCKVGFKYQDGRCVRVTKVHYGKTCQKDEECDTPYTVCLETRCTCREGTQEVQGSCKPNYNCVVGQPSVNDGKVRKCTVSAADYQGVIPDSSQCPESYYCVDMGSKTLSTINNKNALVRSGICCPLLSPACPYGKAIAVTSKEICASQCPDRTHYCLVDQNMPNVAACCIKPCPGNDIYSEGLCHTPLSIGEQCQTQAQCSLSNARCLEDANGGKWMFNFPMS